MKKAMFLLQIVAFPIIFGLKIFDYLIFDEVIKTGKYFPESLIGTIVVFFLINSIHKIRDVDKDLRHKIVDIYSSIWLLIYTHMIILSYALQLCCNELLIGELILYISNTTNMVFITIVLFCIDWKNFKYI